MSKLLFQNTTIVGAGAIGRSWMFVFSRAGCNVKVYDIAQAPLDVCAKWLDSFLDEEVEGGYMTRDAANACKARISYTTDLAEALKGSQYVQENTSERIELKKKVYAQIDAAADPKTIIASSTSALNVDDFSGELPGAARCIMAHPFNPPYVLPAVEILGNRATSKKTIDDTIQFMKDIGQKPVFMKKFVPGFIGNRLQAAILRESFHLVEDGVADVADVESLVYNALGLRWALFGNFGVNNTNADEGAASYYKQFEGTYTELSHDMRSDPPNFSPEMVARIHKGISELEGGASPMELGRWRDKVIRRIRMLKEEIPHPGGKQ